MNKREKEMLQWQLDHEKAVLKQLEKQYQTALDEINEKIILLQSRTVYDSDGIGRNEQLPLNMLPQSRIYQIEHQKALKGQIEAILEKLHGDEYETIQQYLEDSYVDSFVGTAYDLAGQGIPLIMPIDQAAAVRAIQTNSKISEGLYESLGVDTGNLKKAIAREATRGIASGLTYQDIARNIQNVSNAPLRNAHRIARTEAHRIQQASTMDAQKAAKAKGADVVKQWDSSLDGRVRKNHRKLDGQIREVDEPFEVDGKKAMFPGDFGRPEEDINCRCVSLTRARWGLDEDELQTLKDRAEYFGLDKTDDFNAFKEKYLKATESEEGKFTYKDTVVSPNVKSAAYRRKFDELGEDKKVTRKMWSSARNMLEHRTGTKFEDMAFIDSKTGKALFQTGYNVESRVEPTKAMKKLVTENPNSIISLHNHPGSTVPSIQDITSAQSRKYKYGVIACHDGRIFKYTVADDLDTVSADIYLRRLDKEFAQETLDNAKIDKVLDLLYNVGVEIEVI